MLQVLNLALPFFGLIFLGFVCGKLRPIPHTGLAWMNFFIIYVALPALFYRILARTPFEQVANIPFIVAVSVSTILAFFLAFAIAWTICRRVPEAALAAAIGGYGNVGYMGPGIAVATLGPEATVPVALIFCFDTAIILFLVPLFLTLSGGGRAGLPAMLLQVVMRVVFHPLIAATLLGVAAAAFRFEAPTALDTLLQFLQNAAAPCALFTLGVTVALRPLKSIPWEVPPVVLVKLLVHPALTLLALSLLSPQPQVWVYTAVMLAGLPPALNVFVLARQYDTWIAEASSAILLGTLVSVLTLTVLMWLITTSRVPYPLFS